ncbi:hypothetical protein BGZ59_003617 [Podila verticillata]|nr:hypothetical protein BGZ59_003617 [Podila verticillata]
MIQLQQQQQQEQQRSVSNTQPASSLVPLTPSSTSKPALVAVKSLLQLIHKQTLEIESVVQQLYDTVAVFQRVVQAMVQLERQVEAAIERIEPSKLLATIHASPPSSSSSLSPSSTPKKSYAFEPSLVETAEIAPLDVLDWVARIRAMYTQELNLKQAQIHPGMTALERFESLADLQRSWGLQKQIDFGLEQEIVERIKAYRRVRSLSIGATSGDGGGGSVKVILESPTHAKQFYDSLARAQIQQLDLTLDWNTTFSDLKLMRDTLLRLPIVKLRLDYRSHSGPTSDIVNRSKRGKPMAQLMIQHPHLVLADFVGADGFFSRSTQDCFSPLPTTTSPLATTTTTTLPGPKLFGPLSPGRVGTSQIREVHIDGTFDYKVHQGRIKTMLEHCPSLTALTLKCKDLDFVWTVYTIRELVANFPQFRYLDLASPQFSAGFDRHDPWSAFGKPHQHEEIKQAADNNLTVIERFGPDLETLLIDDNFSNEHITLLELVTRDHCKLKLLEMRIGFALIANSAITDVGQDCLTMILRRQLACELMFAMSHDDRMDWFPFLGGVYDKTSTIRIDFQRINKSIPLLEQRIPQPPPSSSSLDQRPAYAILVLEFRGAGGVLKPATVQSLVRILSLAPRLQILGMTNFEMDRVEWDQVLEMVSLDDLKELSLEETNVNGHHVALLMNRIVVGDPLRILTLGKTALKSQDIEGLKMAMQERIPNCKLVL